MLAPLTIPDIFAAEACDRIIARAEAGRYAPAGLVRGAAGGDIRSAEVFWIDDSPADAWIESRITEIVATANRDHFGFALEEFAERLQVARYEAASNGHFDWHSDVGAGPLAARRKLTLVVQLSDPDSYDGGRLETNIDGRARIAPLARGSALLFPSFVLHRVTPVTRGTRCSLTTWVHGAPFR